MISLEGLVMTVIWLIVVGLIFWLLWWLIHYISPPEPFKKVATVVLMILAVLACIFVLLSLATGRPVFRP